jgi:predicted anti-sigma-YlaC factor YlaD
MGHDPQRAAAAYLGGELGRRQRERLEAHLLECEDCWREVQAARGGRALAESAREVAPQHLCDRVRATIDATPAGRRRWAVRWAPLAAAVTLAAVVAGGLLLVERQAAQPAPIAAAVASYQTRTPAWSGPAHPPPVQQVGDLRWRGSGRGTLAGLPVVAHTYQDTAGHRIVLLQADRSFPTARGAHHPAGSDTWVSEVDGVVLFCTDRPTPSLVVGQDRALVLLAASRLGLDLRGQEGSP